MVSKNTVRPTLLFQAKGENGQLDWPENNSTERFFVNAAKMVPRSSSREVRIRVPVLCSLF